MRWIVGVVALVVTSWLLHKVSATAPLEGRATLGLGLLLLGAALGGAIAARIGLSRVTGYLVAGLAIGPSWRGDVRADEVDALQIVLNAGLALIAVGVGAELRLEFLRRHARAVLRACAGTILLPIVGVALFVVALGAWFPLTTHQPLGDRLTVGLVLGVLAAASSPLVIKAVADELQAQGLFARLIVAIAALKDAALMLILALGFALVSQIASQGSVEPAILWRPAVVFMASVGLGVLGGWVTALYMRVVFEQGPLLLLAFGFTVAYVSRVLQLEVLVVGLAAGCFLINQTRSEGERLLRALNRAAGPLYAVTFVLFGAGLTTSALSEVWPWVMAVAAVRAFGLHYGLVWAGRDVAVSPSLARNGWLGLVPQAGVTLGLAALVRRAFPEWGVSLEAFVLGMIGVHEAIGPIMFRWALQRPGAGEARNAEVVQADGMAVVPGGRM